APAAGVPRVGVGAGDGVDLGAAGGVVDEGEGEGVGQTGVDGSVQEDAAVVGRANQGQVGADAVEGVVDRARVVRDPLAGDETPARVDPGDERLGRGV